MSCSSIVYFSWIISLFFFAQTEAYRDPRIQENHYNFYRRHYEESNVQVRGNTTVGQVGCQIFGFCPENYYKHQQSSKFKSVFEWKRMDFDYSSKADRVRDIEAKTFIPGSGAPIDVDVYYKPDGSRTVFMTIPRFLDGIPATLGTVSVSQFTGQPIFKPYPSWKWHRQPQNCNKDRLVSVYRVKIDDCGRMWVLDTGRLLAEQVCPMQIMAFDLKTNQLLYRKDIPQSLLKPISILVTPIVEVSDNYCSKTFVYIADCQAFTIIVHDTSSGFFWMVSDKTMYPYPSYGTFNIQGDEFDLMDGVLGMDLGTYIHGQDRKLHYHSLSSVTENWVFTSYLKNRTLSEQDSGLHPKVFHVYKGTRQSQSAAQAVDKYGIAYFGQMTETTINCWNTATEYGPANIDVVEYNPKTLQFASGVKIINNPRGFQELWILTSRLQKVITDTIRPDEVNFRVLAVKVDDALAGTKCKISEKVPNKNNKSRCFGYGCGSRHAETLNVRRY